MEGLKSLVEKYKAEIDAIYDTKDISLELQITDLNRGGKYDPKTKTVTLDLGLMTLEAFSNGTLDSKKAAHSLIASLNHELFHAWQYKFIEKFPDNILAKQYNYDDQNYYDINRAIRFEGASSLDAFNAYEAQRLEAHARDMASAMLEAQGITSK